MTLNAYALTQENGGAETWLFVLLAINCGMYHCNIASLTYDSLRFDGEQSYLWWQRD